VRASHALCYGGSLRSPYVVCGLRPHACDVCAALRFAACTSCAASRGTRAIHSVVLIRLGSLARVTRRPRSAAGQDTRRPIRCRRSLRTVSALAWHVRGCVLATTNRPLSSIGPRTNATAACRGHAPKPQAERPRCASLVWWTAAACSAYPLRGTASGQGALPPDNPPTHFGLIRLCVSARCASYDTKS
jgi:hypothetical protein